MIFEKIRKVTSEELGIEEDTIKIDMSFQNDLGADSLDLFQIIMELEEEFNIQIEDAEDIVTLEDAVSYVKRKIEQ
ncbi:acyl carrier protein [Clostridium algidicarnis]|uniref:acyl carrier protein n=1 Tax=Clostridium algidicarnis TaxID=37659 RepID=UPI000497AAD1|nr:acyl carrier protein [Clostridium algidicarnis]MBB6630318.1 acyl carrier protein [Clostridium algidicarnis]MBB6697736.1 acyl carrier protein [Clostridium algidicarnis]MBU3192866.1 acyl carrier protein [Clostridium algidicarnis]MBU3203543.1 acyl carrier protein [Clostridium algidicarnis]MBU3211697.1 acyl carrier protein [Clostridium algidicarnis]